MIGRRTLALVSFNVAAALIIVGLFSLAVWQMHRRAWKLDLITRIEARVNAPAVAAPGRERWPGVSAASDEYRRVTITGRWLESRPALVQAVTEHGGGYWVLAPFARNDGTTVFVNRGFVPAGRVDSAWLRAPTGAPVDVTGLLRLTEPHGAFLRSNDPAADRWFSRDVATIAAARGLSAVAPYFIDAERNSGGHAWPAAGLTALSFSNNHLIYAVTWGILAAMAAAGAIFVNLETFRRGRSPDQQGRSAER